MRTARRRGEPTGTIDRSPRLHVAPQECRDMPAMAAALQADAMRTHSLVTWIVTRGEAAYPGEFVGRLMTNAPTSSS